MSHSTIKSVRSLRALSSVFCMNVELLNFNALFRLFRLSWQPRTCTCTCECRHLYMHMYTPPILGRPGPLALCDRKGRMPVQWRAVHSLEEAPRRRTPEEQRQERLRQKRAFGAAKRRAAKAMKPQVAAHYVEVDASPRCDYLAQLPQELFAYMMGSNTNPWLHAEELALLRAVNKSLRAAAIELVGHHELLLMPKTVAWQNRELMHWGRAEARQEQWRRQGLLGRRVEIWWSGDEMYRSGTIVGWAKGSGRARVELDEVAGLGQYADWRSESELNFI